MPLSNSQRLALSSVRGVPHPRATATAPTALDELPEACDALTTSPRKLLLGSHAMRLQASRQRGLYVAQTP